MKEPRFDLDYTYGRQGELLIKDILEQLAAGDARIETKRPRNPDPMFYVETHQNAWGLGEWKPSGIQTTESEYHAIVLGDTGNVVMVPTRTLRAAARRAHTARCERGDNPTEGVLVDLRDALGW